MLSEIRIDCPKCRKMVVVRVVNTGITMLYYCKECGELLERFDYD